MGERPARMNDNHENGAVSRWLAIRTKPGSQTPRRNYRTETTRSRKGYRLAPTLNPDLSAIESALSEAGFHCYMPAERRLQRDRRLPFLWKPRRFALMVGYVFVRDPQDLEALEQVGGVQGVVRDGSGRPLVMSFADLMQIRAVEAAREVQFDQQSRAARQTLRRRMKDDPSLRRIVERLDIAGTLTVPIEFGVLVA